MAGNSKANTPAKEKNDRRKSAGKSSSTTITLRVNPKKLRNLLDPSPTKEESPIKASPPPQTETPAPAATQDENATPSSPGTPAPNGSSSQVPVGPPTDGAKKKGVKRSAAVANKDDPSAKIRGKPGPKKRARLDDGTLDPTKGGNSYHKLGPKANQGAINAGLRALDRSGAPCRKWSKGGFKLKSFTGVNWEIPRWTAPPKPKPEAEGADSAASADSSNKENKEGSQMKSDNSTSNVEGEQRSIPPSVHASSPAPVPIVAA
ncbi:INO80 complex, subunit Ies4 [Xylariaceae sp. FL0255]|nr:INO80 complex, subunit Ies4 [Xylariaceae sp. FL0255]